MAHSTQLGVDGSLGTGATSLYTVPSGIRTILKSIVLSNQHTAAQSVLVTLYHGATVLSYLHYPLAAPGAAGQSVFSLPWIVLNVGDSIEAATTLGPATIIVSGAELTE